MSTQLQPERRAHASGVTPPRAADIGHTVGSILARLEEKVKAKLLQHEGVDYPALMDEAIREWEAEEAPEREERRRALTRRLAVFTGLAVAVSLLGQVAALLLLWTAFARGG